MTIKNALEKSRRLLASTPTCQLDNEAILAFVLKKNRAQLISSSEETLTNEQIEQYIQLVQERSKGKPLAYLTNTKEFFGNAFFVDDRVLIPRPETEELVEESIRFLKDHPAVDTVIDVGTGSGCIAISIALEFPSHNVLGLDVSQHALEVARINKEQYSIKNLELIHSNLLEEITFSSTSHLNAKNPSAIMCNLPYIGTKTHTAVDPAVKQYEPDLALYGGETGIELYKKLCEQIRDNTLNVPYLIMEIAPGQEDQLLPYAKKTLPNLHFTCKNDLAGLARMVIGRID